MRLRWEDEGKNDEKIVLFINYTILTKVSHIKTHDYLLVKIVINVISWSWHQMCETFQAYFSK